MIRVLIMAMDEKRGIGSSESLSGLPWHIPAETAYFKKMTQGNGVKGKFAVVMGRSTYARILSLREKRDVSDITLCRPLAMSGRDVYLLSANDYFPHKTVRSIEEITEYDALFICGGKQAYQTAIADKVVDFALISQVKGVYRSDVFMPVFEDGMRFLKAFSFPDFTVRAYKANAKADDALFDEMLSFL